jgi:Holliday junction resolvase
MSHNEGALQRSIVRRLKAEGMWCCKLASPARAGVPDLLVIDQGTTFFIEVKTPTGRGRLSRLQLETIETMRNHGAWVFVLNALDQLDPLLESRPWQNSKHLT